ncbi:zinc finger protein 62-like [Cimex lectularius]|uniref:C2H2-type domain-containing protein n=1 Tax=Cimex lectularius TaxID=79782 RepID=A0A8I6SEZ3_CIMLE|nr:zinc finger protein 62-like [Cimex lectularius]
MAHAFQILTMPLKQFQCDGCPRRYMNKRSLYNHRKYECGRKPPIWCPHCEYYSFLRSLYLIVSIPFFFLGKFHRCDICNKVYKNEKSLKRHKRYECGVDPQFSCIHCDYKSKQRVSLMRHIACRHTPGFSFLRKYKKMAGTGRNSSVESKEFHPCDVCMKRYKSTRSLQRHKKYECGIEPQFLCTYCDYKSKHKDKLHYCDICMKRFKSSRTLHRHKKYECGIEPQFLCTYCDYKSKRKSSKVHGWYRKKYEVKSNPCSSYVHYKLHHCDICMKRFKSSRTLHRHKKYECGVEPQFLCTHCDYKSKQKGFSTKSSVKIGGRNVQHFSSSALCFFLFFNISIRYFLDKRHHCDICLKRYKSTRSLKRHKKYECGVEPQFLCMYCDFKCKQKGKYYVCDVCFNRYKNRWNLKRHKKYECGVEPQFPCPHCEYKSKQKGHLKIHIARRHTPKTPPT